MGILATTTQNQVLPVEIVEQAEVKQQDFQPLESNSLR